MEKNEWSVLALEKGVRRAHLVCPWDGSILQELYTWDRSGLLVSRDLYKDFRQADAKDKQEIYRLMRPLCDLGVFRWDIGSYYVTQGTIIS